MELENKHWQMEIFIKENIKIIKEMEMENLFGQMKIFMKENGRIIK